MTIYILLIFSRKDNTWASQVALVTKNIPANSGNARDEVSILGSGRSPGVRNYTPF